MVDLSHCNRVWMITDTHLGVRNSLEEWIEIMRDYFYNEFIPLVRKEYKPGDVLFHMGDVFDSRHAITLKVLDLAIDIFEELASIFVDGIYIIAGNHDCLDIDTELLTNRGWIRYDDIKHNDIILSHLPDGTCKWDKIEDIIIKDGPKTLNTVETNHISLVCTDGHRVLHQHKSNKGYSDLKYSTFNNLTGRIKIPVAANSNNNPSNLLDDEIRLAAWILTDGCIQKNKVTISQSKPAEKIYEILDNLGYSYYIYERERNITEICGKLLKNNPLPQRDIVLDANSGRLAMQIIADKKVFNHKFFTFDDRQFDIFLNSCIDGDGSRYSKRDCLILFGKKDFLDIMQSMCIQHGYRAMLHQSNRGDWRLNISNKKTAEFDMCVRSSTISYSDKVWCLSVPETNFMVRRNGKAFFTGNCWYKTTNEINSLKVLKRIPNIHIYDMEPETIKVGNSKFLMMPWQKDHATDVEAIQKYGSGHDYLCCHMDVYGMKGSRFNTLDSGVDTKAFSLFKQVYSGHIHYAQKMKNITMLGSPYELTRSDMYNQKGIVMLDTETDTETLYPNTTSPKFVSLTMTSLLEKCPDELKEYMRGNFVDIQVDSPNFLKIPINSIVELLDNEFRSINFIPPSFTNVVPDSDPQNADLKDFDIKDTITKFCAESAYDEDTKKKLEESLVKLYDRTIEIYAAK